MAQISIPIPDEQISSAVMEIAKKMNLVPADDLKGSLGILTNSVRSVVAVSLQIGSARLSLMSFQKRIMQMAAGV